MQRLEIGGTMTVEAGEDETVLFGDEADGSSSESGEKADLIPSTSALRINYPNPFNRGTTIPYAIGDANRAGTQVELDIFNLGGQRVRSLVNRWQEPGAYSIVWDGADDFGKEQATGMYIARLRTKISTDLRKMLLVK